MEPSPRPRALVVDIYRPVVSSGQSAHKPSRKYPVIDKYFTFDVSAPRPLKPEVDMWQRWLWCWLSQNPGDFFRSALFLAVGIFGLQYSVKFAIHIFIFLRLFQAPGDFCHSSFSLIGWDGYVVYIIYMLKFVIDLFLFCITHTLTHALTISLTRSLTDSLARSQTDWLTE